MPRLIRCSRKPIRFGRTHDSLRYSSSVQLIVKQWFWKDWLSKLKIFDDFCNQYLTLWISNYWLAHFTNDEKCTKQMMGRLHGHMYRIDKHKHKHTHTHYLYLYLYFSICVFVQQAASHFIYRISVTRCIQIASRTSTTGLANSWGSQSALYQLWRALPNTNTVTNANTNCRSHSKLAY